MILAVLIATSRIAVISVGADPVPVGLLQRGIESRLVASPAIELVDARAIASGIGVRAPGTNSHAIDPEAQQRLDGLVEAARRDSTAGEYAGALERLLLAEGLVDPAGTDDRVRIHLLRCLVFLKIDDRGKAAESARSALELQPDLVVDQRLFPPSVDKLMSEVRPTLPIRYTIELLEAPSAARFLLDGRPVARRFAASPGRHTLSVGAPGFRTMEIALDVTRNASLDASPPIALEKALDSSLFDQAWATNAAAKDRSAARDLATRLHVDCVVLVASRTTPSAEARAILVWPASGRTEIGPTKPVSPVGRAALTEWIAFIVETAPPAPAAIVPEVSGVSGSPAPAATTPVVRRVDAAPDRDAGVPARRVHVKSGLAFISIPAGKFMMGCATGDARCAADERPAHKEKVSTFSITETAVTAEAYGRCVEAGSCTAANTYIDSCNSGKRPAHPINCVDWKQASDFCGWIGGRLPTAVEREYVAKGGEDRIFPWGNAEPDSTRAKYGSEDGTDAVAAHPAGASRWSVHDLAGNVWEWTSTRSGESYEVRGGSWSSSPAEIRSSFRQKLDRGYRNSHVGFRCVD